MPIVAKPAKTSLTVFLLGLFTGTLDGICAIIWSYKAGPVIIFQYIASAAFGPRQAFSGGWPMVYWGIAFHYFIAFAFTVLWYKTYNWFYKILGNEFIVAFVYGLLTWIIMNILVLPFTQIGMKPFKILPTIIGMAILVFAVGLPIALVAERKIKNQANAGKSERVFLHNK
ncbi:MAG TPA: hypothetical protein VIM55_17180 [Mucilaginibacter sp.]